MASNFPIVLGLQSISDQVQISPVTKPFTSGIKSGFWARRKASSKRQLCSMSSKHTDELALDQYHPGTGLHDNRLGLPHPHLPPNGVLVPWVWPCTLPILQVLRTLAYCTRFSRYISSDISRAGA